MMKRQWFQRVLTAAGLLVLTAASASAQIVQVNRSDSRQAIGFTFGGFFLPGIDSRTEGDTLVANLFAADPLDFEIKDFNHVTFGAEYLAGVSDFLEVGVGVGYYQRTVPSVYRFLENSDGSEIEQDLKLRIVPVTATLRFLPVGRGNGVEPYVGGGVGVFPWRYSESGEFVNPDSDVIFSNRYTADGVAVGPVLLGGIRFPVTDAVTIGGEVRWQKAKADTGGFDAGFLGEKIDLTGTTANFTIHFKF